MPLKAGAGLDVGPVTLAQVQFEAAVPLAHASGDHISEGQFAGYLGVLHARQGRHDDARWCLESGEAMLRSAPDAFGLRALIDPARD